MFTKFRDQAILIFFFFSVIKLASASQIGNLLPELFSNTVLLAKPDVSVSSTPEGPVYTDFIFTASFLGGRPAGEQKDSCPAIPGYACACVYLCACVCVCPYLSVCVSTCKLLCPDHLFVDIMMVPLVVWQFPICLL